MAEQTIVVSAPDRFEATDLHFKLVKRRDIFHADGEKNDSKVNLLAVSDSMGLTFVGSLDSLYIIQTDSIEEENLRFKKIDLHKRPSHIALNCDETFLAVGYSTQNGCCCTIFDLNMLPSQGSLSVLKEVQLCSVPGVAITDICWNPTVVNLFACCFQDGSLLVVEVNSGSVSILGDLPKESGVSCFSWSPKGKQVVVGFLNGELKQYQYKPQLQLAKTIPAPVFNGNKVAVAGVIWISNFQFGVYYNQLTVDSIQPSFNIVNTPKNMPITFINYDDIAFGATGVGAYYFFHLAPWNLIFVAATDSNEVNPLHSDDGKTWTHWSMGDSSRAELPLSQNQEETYPWGLAVDLCSQKQVMSPKTDVLLPPMPRLLFLSDEGRLCLFNVISLMKETPFICSPPTKPIDVKYFETGQPKVTTKILPTDRAAFNDPPPPPSSTPTQSLTQFTSTFPVVSPVSTKAAAPISFVGFQAQKPIQAVVPNTSPLPLASSLSQPAVTAVTKPSTALLQSTTVVAQPLLVKPPVSQLTTSQKPESTQNVAQSTGLTAKDAAAAEKPVTENEIDDAVYCAAITDELNALTEELNKTLSSRGCLDIKLDPEEKFHGSLKQLGTLQEFLREVDADTIAHAEEVSELKLNVLELVSKVEDSRLAAKRLGTPFATQLKRNEQLDPLTARTLRDVLALKTHINTQLTQISSHLDHQWEEYQRSCRKQSKKEMKTPWMEDVYKTIDLHRKVLSRQKLDLDKLQKETEQRTVRGSWASRANTSSLNHNESTRSASMSKLAESLLGMSLSTVQSGDDGLEELIAESKQQKLKYNDLTAKEITNLLDRFEDAQVPVVSHALSFSEREAHKQEVAARLKTAAERFKQKRDCSKSTSSEVNTDSSVPLTSAMTSHIPSWGVQHISSSLPPVSHVQVPNTSPSPLKHHELLGESKLNSPIALQKTSPNVSKVGSTSPLFVTPTSMTSFKSNVGSSVFGGGSTPTSSSIFASNISAPTLFQNSSSNLFSSTKGSFNFGSSVTDNKSVVSSKPSAPTSVSVTDKPQTTASFTFNLSYTNPGKSLYDTSTAQQNSETPRINFNVSPISSKVLSTQASATDVTTGKTSTSLPLSVSSSGGLFTSIAATGFSGIQTTATTTLTFSSVITSTTESKIGNIPSTVSTMTPNIASSVFGGGGNLPKITTGEVTASDGVSSLNTSSPSVTAANATSPTSVNSSSDSSTNIGSQLLPSKSSGSIFGSSIAPSGLFSSVSTNSGNSFISTAQSVNSVTNSNNVFTSNTSGSLFGAISTTTSSSRPSDDVVASSTTTISSIATPSSASQITNKAGSTFGVSVANTQKPLETSTSGGNSNTTETPFVFGTVSNTFTSTSSTTTSTASIFGSSAFSPATTSISTSVFGSTFGQAATTASLFSTTTQPVSTTSLFATATSTPSLFGATSPTTTVSSMFGVASPTTTNITTPTLFAAATTSAAPTIFGSSPVTTSSLFGAIAPTTTPSIFGSAASTTTTQPIFGISTPTTTIATTFFGSGTPTTAQPSIFGTTTPTTTSSGFGSDLGQTTNLFAQVLGGTQQSQSGNIFSQTTPSKSPFETGGNIFGSPPASSSSIFGQTPTTLFGSTSTSSNIFGSGTTSSTFFGQSPFSSGTAAPNQNPFGATSTSSSFGSSAFASKPIFGQSIFGQSGSSIFGASNTESSAPIFGGSTQSSANAFQSPSTFASSGPFSGGNGTVGQAGFGTAVPFTKASGGFGGSPSFGTTSGFGGSATFGGAPAFGSPSAFGSPTKTFGPSNSQGSPAFGQTQGTTAFESMANQNSVGFGNLAQMGGSQSFGSNFTTPTSTFGSTQSSYGGTSFSSWR